MFCFNIKLNSKQSNL